MSLSKTLKTGALTGLMGLAGACSTMGPYETRHVCNDLFVFTPGFLEPGSCKDAREEVRARDAEDRARQGQSGVTVKTPEGYAVNLRISDKVVYRGKNHMIWEVNPPYIEIIPPNETDGWYNPKNSFSISIKELDMLKK